MKKTVQQSSLCKLLATYLKNNLLVEALIKSLINLTHECLCSEPVTGYAIGMFLFWFSMQLHYFCSGHWHNYLLQPEQGVTVDSIFLDVYGYMQGILTEGMAQHS